MKVDDLTDPVDRALLPVLRHAVRAFAFPERHSWRLAYKTAAERWGEARGLALAHATFDMVSAFLGQGVELEVNDPLDLEQRSDVNAQEHLILLMLGFMRKEDTSNARNTVLQLCNNKVYSAVVRSSLALAERLDHTTPARKTEPPRLMAVS